MGVHAVSKEPRYGTDMSPDGEFFTARRPEDVAVDQQMASFGFDLETLTDWECMAWAMHGQRPFTLLMDYALGMAAWTWKTEHSDSSGLPLTLSTPPLCMIALAGYRLAAGERIYEADRVPLEAVLVLLSHDALTRDLVTIEPGFDQTGRMREDDQRNLRDAVQPGSSLPWQQWREQAAHIVQSNLDDAPAFGRATIFRDRLSYVRWMRVRRNWYDHPDLSPEHDENAPADERC